MTDYVFSKYCRLLALEEVGQFASRASICLSYLLIEELEGGLNKTDVVLLMKVENCAKLTFAE